MITMQFQYDTNRVFLTDEQNKLLAEVTFDTLSDTSVDITHTFVDDSLRGQGMAGKIMAATAEYLKQQQKQIKCTCSYAQHWFAKHEEYQNILL